MLSSTHDLLSEYRPTTANEDAFRRRMLILTEAGDFAFDRSHFVPGHFTASAFVLSPRKDSIALIHHRKLKRWLQPGGHLETNDPSPWQAALREVSEEVGIDPRHLHGDPHLFDIDIHTIPAHKSEPEHEHFDLRFLFHADTERLIAGDDVKDARWWQLTLLPVQGGDESVERAVRKLVTKT